MLTELVTLTDATDGFATRLIARGPGSGINRPVLTLTNSIAAEKYGIREAVEDFPSAVDLSDLQRKAAERLAEISDDSRFQSISIRVSGPNRPVFRMGQRVRFTDTRLEVSTTAKVVGIEWGDESTTLDLGEVPANLADLLDEDKINERKAAALGLPIPTGLRARGVVGGIEVLVNPFTGSRAVGVEVHIGTVQAFEADASTLAVKGNGTRFTIGSLVAGRRYFVRVRAFDAHNNLSEFTDAVGAVATGVTADDIDPSVMDDIRHAEAVAGVVEASKEVWDRAQAIESDLTFKFENLSGYLERAQLDSTLTNELDGLDDRIGYAEADIELLEDEIALRATKIEVGALDGRVESAEQTIGAHGIRLTTAEQDISFVDGRVDNAFSEIQVNAGNISLVSAKFRSMQLVTGDGRPIATGDGKVLVTGQTSAAQILGLPMAYARLNITSDAIESIVNDEGGMWSRINQNAQEIDLRVAKGEIISSINLSSESARIKANRLVISGPNDAGGKLAIEDAAGNTVAVLGDVSGHFGAPNNSYGLAAKDGTGLFIQNLRIGGDTIVTGNVDITNSGNTSHRFQVRDSGNTVRAALGNIAGLAGAPSNTYGLFLDASNLWVRGMAVVRKMGMIDAWVPYGGDPSDPYNRYYTHVGEPTDFIWAWRDARGPYGEPSPHVRTRSLPSLSSPSSWSANPLFGTRFSFNGRLHRKGVVELTASASAGAGGAIAIWGNTGTSGNPSWTFIKMLSTPLQLGTEWVSFTPPSAGFTEISVAIAAIWKGTWPSGFEVSGSGGGIVRIYEGDI